MGIGHQHDPQQPHTIRNSAWAKRIRAPQVWPAAVLQTHGKRAQHMAESVTRPAGLLGYGRKVAAKHDRS